MKISGRPKQVQYSDTESERLNFVIHDMHKKGSTNAEIALRLNLTYAFVSTRIHRMRVAGVLPKFETKDPVRAASMSTRGRVRIGHIRELFNRLGKEKTKRLFARTPRDASVVDYVADILSDILSDEIEGSGDASSS